MFDKFKVRYAYNEGRGGHTWDSWRNHLFVFAPLLFQERDVGFRAALRRPSLPRPL